MKKRRYAVILVQICLLLACSPPNPFAGKWTLKMYSEGIGDRWGTGGVMVFKKDMTFASSGNEGGGISSGTYSFADGILEINFTHIGGEPEEENHSGIPMPYTFRDEDYFEIRDDGVSLVFERVKD